MCKCANHLFQDISIETNQQYKILQEDLMGALANTRKMKQLSKNPMTLKAFFGIEFTF